MRKLKRMGILIAVLALLLFVLSNIRNVDVRVFLWDYEIALALVIFLSSLIGFLLGIFVAMQVDRPGRARHHDSDTPTS